VKRLIYAALLAVLIHGALLVAKIPWEIPKVLTPQSREVTIDLVQTTRISPEPASNPVAPILQETARKRPSPKTPRIINIPDQAPSPIPDPPVNDKPPIQPSEKDPPEARQVENHLSEALESTVQSSTPTEDAGAEVQLSVPLYETNPSPNYPRVAQRRRYQGTVLLDVLVDTTGNAIQVRVAQSSGYTVLDRSAKTDVQQWRFKPARRGFKPIEMWVQVPVRYELKNGSSPN
jgi:protein TonB